MFARLWWKEARQTWAVWVFLALVGVAIQSYLFSAWRAEMPAGTYARVALVISLMYLFLIAAAVFAGERENGTLWILDVMPADRLRVWTAKASFALATTLALGLLLWLSALAFGDSFVVSRRVFLTTLVWGLTALGWGLLWSAVLPNALQAAVLAMVSLCLTLLALVNLQRGPTVEAMPALLALAMLTTGASAWAFRAGGPPRREPRRARPIAPIEAAPVPVPDEAATVRRPGRTWTLSVPRLVWETWRQVRAELGMLVGLALAGALLPHLIMSGNPNSSDLLWFATLGAILVALVTGVLAFNSENRRRTHRFLLHHGARPVVVWAVKVAAWWATALVLWAMILLPVWLTRPSDPRYSPLGTIGLGSMTSWAVWGLTIPFAIAVLCGMVFRRGIMAGMIALVASLAAMVPLFLLLSAHVLFPWHWPYAAIGFLVAGLLWSADWLYDATGWRRWARLVLYAAIPLLILPPLYIAGRAWGVPSLPPGQVEAFLQRERVVAPVSEADNAAPLYRDAYGLISRDAYPEPEPSQGRTQETAVGGTGVAGAVPTGVPVASRAPMWVSDSRFLDQESFDPPPAGVIAWLERLEPALATLREGARRPACRYVDLRTATEFDRMDEPPVDRLIVPLAVSARVRLVQGDLDGSWTEVETLARMARQYSSVSSWSIHRIDPVADALVLQWVTDPRQTVATLEKAAHAWKAMPPRASPADRIRVDAALFHNTIDLPREELIDRLLYGRASIKRKVQPIERLRYEIQTTAWEIDRACNAFNVLAAAQIQRREREKLFVPHPRGLPADQWRWFSRLVDPFWSLSIEDGNRTFSYSPELLNTLAITTPLVESSSMGVGSLLEGRAETMRRAIWLSFLLRLHQARHAGKLPGTLNELFARPGEKDELVATPEDIVDPYSGKPFGYVASHGQPLLPAGAIEPLSRHDSGRSDSRLKPAEDCLLLYSVGPDGTDDRAERNVGFDQLGDYVVPLRDNISPPRGEPR